MTNKNDCNNCIHNNNCEHLNELIEYLDMYDTNREEKNELKKMFSNICRYYREN